MATPYWGQLPGPKIVKNRRMSDDDGPSSLDAPLNHNQSSKPNRASVQTAVTAATETTLNPYDSPTNSSFAPHGLAPRPSSYQRPLPAAAESTSAPAARSSRRKSGTPDDLENESVDAALPAAPEAPRAPQVSYRHSYGNGGLPDTHPAPGLDKASRPSGPSTRSEKMEYGEAHRRCDDPYRGLGHAGIAAPLAPMDSSRRVSSGPSEHRKKSAMSRSPLQRLELTLDSMTKEEKRARVEAAERRARERASQREGDAPASETLPTQPRSSHHQRPAASHGDTIPAMVPSAGAVAGDRPVSREASAVRGATAGHPPPRRHHQVEDPIYDAPFPQARELAPAAPPTDANMDLPRRNLSFRERAARDEMSIPGTDDTVQPPRTAAADGSGGFVLTRNGSNKLKKEPPGDPWYHMRKEAERRMDSISKRQATTAEVPPRSSSPQYVRDKELPPARSNAGRPSIAVGDRDAHYPVAGGDTQGIQRRATEPVQSRGLGDEYFAPVTRAKVAERQWAEDQLPTAQGTAAQQRKLERQDSDYSSESSHHHHVSNMLYKGREGMQPGDGLYRPPQWLDEWKKATVGALSGSLLNMNEEKLATVDRSKAWWEDGGRRRSSYSSKPRKAEAFDGEYDDLNAPTRFKPPLCLECGPLVRYCGMRYDQIPTRSRSGAVTDREMWRGSIMIVTRDSESSYDIVPMLRLFVQDIELLPAPPHDINGDLSPEYVDPIAGHPTLGRNGETLYVRPVEHLEEGKDLSQHETDQGLFESARSAPDAPPPDGSPDYQGTFASRMRRIDVDGEKVQKYKDVRGFRLHAERGCTFWRFNIEVELRDKQQRIAYRINRGPANAFWVPARGKPMNVMFHSCNGFSLGAKADELSGPDPMWRDVLNNHQTSPFHVMIGGGDQIYNDEVADECDLFIDWLEIRNPFNKHNAPFTPELQSQLEDFYFQRYCKWFSTGLFGLANSQIPMVNTWSDRESFNGYGSYPHRDMDSPVLSGLGAVAFKYYMLFQHQSIIPETEEDEPSWILGNEPGPYVNELARNVYVSLGSKLALLAADCRTERTEDNVIDDKTWEKIMNRLYAEVRRGQVEHLLVVFPVPIAYPRLDWLENILTSRAMGPVKALGRRGMLGNALNKIDDGSEVVDDLRDHWTAKNHKHERSIVIEDLQDLAMDKSLRVTILSGDVNLAAVGQFYSNHNLGLPKHKDPRYMPNVISSAIANAPPPDIMADVLNKRHKVHHFDKQTDESMIPIFEHGVDGKPRNNKRLLPHRNWCSIRPWAPGSTPPPTPPPPQAFGGSPSPPPAGPGSGILRRLSLSGSSQGPDMSRDSVRGPRPPVSGGGGLFRTLSRSLSRRNSTKGGRPAKLTRTLSLGRGDAERRGFLGFGRRSSQNRPDDGGINGQWGQESEEDEYLERHFPSHAQPMGLRGGAVHDEYSDGDDEDFTARPPRRAQTLGAQPMSDQDIPPQALKPFHRTPTGLSTKQMRKAGNYEVDLEGGLDICLNVEVSPKDPTGITVPYRILVPRLVFQYTPETDQAPASEPSRFKRLLSFRRKENAPPASAGDEDEYDDDDEETEEGQQQEF